MGFIYQIVNDINNKIYIGATNFPLETRFKQHFEESKRERAKNRPLYKAICEYGIEHFHIELIEETDNLDEREIYWIKKKQTANKGYNISLGGKGKKFVDDEIVIKTYRENKNIAKVSRKLHIDQHTVLTVLRRNNIEKSDGIELLKEVMTREYGISVNMYSLDNQYLRTFSSITEAGRYMQENNLTKCKLSTISQHIREVCRGDRKTAAKHKWSYSDA